MVSHPSFTASHVQTGLHRVTMGLRHHAASMQKIKVDFSKVPDWMRRATRLSIAVVSFGILGHCVRFPAGYQAFASNFRQSCNWAAITCIVVTAPLIGKVAQVAFDRLLGTAVGGFIGFVCFTLGFHAFGAWGGGVFISLMSGLIVWGTTYLAFKRSLDQLVRFVQLTYIIVAFGAKPDKGAFLLALLRVGGIFAGGLLSVVLAVVVLPRSASIDCLLEMKKAIKALYDLNQEVWALSGVTGQNGARHLSRKPHRHGYSALQLRLDAAKPVESAPLPALSGSAAASFASVAAAAASMHPSASDPALGATAAAAASTEVKEADCRRRGDGGSGSADSLPSRPGGLRKGIHDNSMEHLNLLVQRDEERESQEAICEKLFAAVYTALGQVDEHLAQTRGEIYIWHFWGRYFFLPGVHWFPVKGRWQVPKKDLEDMATCVRRVARMLWTLLLDFEEGFGSEMEAVLRLYYPKQLLSELANYQALAILDLLRAFPSGTTIEVDNLFTLGQVTDCLMQISDARARNTVFKIKRRRAGAATAAATAGAAVAATAASLGVGRSPGLESSDSALTAATAAATGGTGAVGTGAPQNAADVSWRSAGRRRSLELSLSRVQQPQEAGAATLPVELEKQPLLAATATSSAPTAPPQAVADGDGSNGGGIGGLSSAQLISSIGLTGSGTAGSRAGLSAAIGGAVDGMPSGNSVSISPAGGGGGGSGVFVSRLMSGTPGELMALHLPPRRYMQEQQQQQRAPQQQQQQQQQQEQQSKQQWLRTSVEKASSPTALAVIQPAPAPPAVQSKESPSLFGDLPFDALLNLSSRPPPAMPPPRPGSSHGGYGAEAAAPAALSPQPPAPPAAGVRHTTPFISYAAVPGLIEQFAIWPAATAAAAAAEVANAANTQDPHAPAAATSPALRSYPTTESTRNNPFSLQPAPTPPSALPKHTTLQAAAEAAAGATAPGALATVDRSSSRGSLNLRGACNRDSDLDRDGFQRMTSVLSSMMVEPVTFPPTEEGYLSQVRWYSFQFVMDEMVNELEEAFHACSAVLRKLPYPIGN